MRDETCEICGEDAFKKLTDLRGAKLIVCEGCYLALKRGETVYDAKGHPYHLVLEWQTGAL